MVNGIFSANLSSAERIKLLELYRQNGIDISIFENTNFNDFNSAVTNIFDTSSSNMTNPITNINIQNVFEELDVDGDSQIEVAKVKEKESAEFMGSMKGSDTIFAGKFVEIATGDAAFKRWNGVGNCCASFVNWCISETAKALGLSTENAIAGSCGGLMDLGKKNNAWIDMKQIRATMSVEEQTKYMQENLKPGMVFVYKRDDGSWHTGIVKQVNPDGSWETIEANTAYQGKSKIVYSHHRDVSNTADRLLGFTDMEAIMRMHNKDKV